ncbi:glycosyltransferase family 2 protein [Rhodoferax aquaticus]|uniref:Glycosyltransferase family 2 protein n=1 Tax=Rhodoferax aquaticus TaxID=2527691 RepID=A0A515EL59_9BURK|nr:glycosyltransferase family A protein [Rhodoferax aquaticus]QDL53396.1 glycosyltransferase family 2 protein [Rhodoferax aquaticus]
MNTIAKTDTSFRVAPLVIISPVRDEAKLIEKTLQSVIAQTVRPTEWVIVDDGSKDDTAAVVKRYAAQYPFIRLVTLQDRGFRKLGGGVIVAFKFGLSQVITKDYAFVAKLDGDMSFGPEYLATMFAEFDADPKLAAVSGKVFRPEGDGFVEEWTIDEHVAGQFKLYRSTAFSAIGGFIEEVLWDGIDIHTARMLGWHTKSFDAPNARLIHHRLMGSSDKNVYRGRLRLGRGIYFMGYHPLYALASAAFRTREKPLVIGGILIMVGYIKAALQGVPRYDNPAFIRYLQNWQMAELKARMRKVLPW